MLALCFAVPARADGVSQWQPYITEAALRFGIPAAWIERVMRAESDGQTTLGGRKIRSRAGAIGLMQLMPDTWEAMRRRLGLDADPDDPRDNIFAGTLYLRLMYERFGYPGLFAAYNAGPARYADHVASGRSLPGETVAYLRTVATPPEPQPTVAQSKPDTLFAIRLKSVDDAVSPQSDQPRASLFVLTHEGPAR